MRIGILGSGVVGQTIGAKLVERGSVIDLGDITTPRGAEMILPIWLRLWGALGTPMFNFKISR